MTDGEGPSPNISWQELWSLHRFCILEELDEQVSEGEPNLNNPSSSNLTSHSPILNLNLLLTDGAGPSPNIPWQELWPLYQFCILEELNQQL